VCVSDLIYNIRCSEHIRIASILYSARIEGGHLNRTFKEMILETDVPKRKMNY